jgi:hypothetical protein
VAKSTWWEERDDVTRFGFFGVAAGRRAAGANEFSSALPDRRHRWRTSPAATVPVGASMTGMSLRADGAINLPSGQVLLALLPVLALVLGVVVFALVDLVRRPAVAYLPKPVWALIIALVALPLGAVAYLVADRRASDRPLPVGPFRELTVRSVPRHPHLRRRPRRGQFHRWCRSTRPFSCRPVR